MLRRRSFFLFPLLAASLLSCTELPTIEENRCGNGFIEVGEDCDEFVASAKKDESRTGAICNASGTVNQCRYSCKSDAECQPYPVSETGSGWRCGVDNVCRQPLGQAPFFVPASTLIPGSADDLFPGDFDGDGRKDILAVGQAGFDIHYIAGDGSLAKSLSIPGAPVVPAIGKLTTSTTVDDFTLDVGQGIGVMLGQTGQTVEPTSYLSLDIKKRYQSPTDPVAPDNMQLIIVDTGATSMMGQHLGPGPLALSATDGGFTLIDASVDPMMGKVILGEFPGLGSKALLGTIPVAFPRPEADRQRFLLALENEPSVYVMDAGASKAAEIKSQIDLPPGLTVHGAAFFAYVNSDSFIDVLVGAAQCSKSPETCTSAEIDVAYGDGDGKFYALENSGQSWDPAALGKAVTYRNVYPGGVLQQGTPQSLSMAEIELYLPLAVGRFNTDIQVDYVNAFGIYISNGGNLISCNTTPNGYCQTERSSAGQFWSEVKTGDFNTDGRLDVAASTRGTKGIAFFNGTGTGVFNTFSIPTDGTPSSLAVGDFDGDFLPDLTFGSVISNPTKVDVHTLFVAFGQPTGAPGLPVSMGAVANLRQIVPGNLSAFGNDAAADIVLLSGIPATFDKTQFPDKDWKVGLSQGNGYRQLQAPLLFFAPKSINVDASPLASAIGIFDDDALKMPSTKQHADVAAIVQSFSTNGFMGMGGLPPFCQLKASLWVLPATGEAVITPPADDSTSIRISTSDPTTLDNFLPFRSLVEAVPINVDGGSTDQLLITFPTYTTCTSNPANLGAHGALLLARFDATTGQPRLTTLIPSVGDNKFLTRVRVGDIDGDGILDVAALQTELNFTNGQISRTNVVVLRGNSQGSFNERLEVTIEGTPVDLALVNTDGNSDLELVVVSVDVKDLGAALFVIDWDKAAANQNNPFKTLLVRADVDPTERGGSLGLDQPSALVGGDFDGDGIDDVAVAVAGGIQMFKGVAK